MNSSPRFWIRSLPAGKGTMLAPGWSAQPLARDHPGIMGRLSVYHSTLDEGCLPHERHDHPEDELVVLLSGELDVLEMDRATRIGPGSFFHHPPGVAHTIRAVGPAPAQFLVAKWHGDTWEAGRSESASYLYHAPQLLPPRVDDKPTMVRICDRSIGNGSRLSAGLAVFATGDAYPPHTHEFDVMLVVLNGTFPGLGHTTKGPAVLFFAHDVPHGFPLGIPEDMKILCFEFHIS